MIAAHKIRRRVTERTLAARVDRWKNEKIDRMVYYAGAVGNGVEGREYD